MNPTIDRTKFLLLTAGIAASACSSRSRENTEAAAQTADTACGPSPAADASFEGYSPPPCPTNEGYACEVPLERFYAALFGAYHYGRSNPPSSYSQGTYTQLNFTTKPTRLPDGKKAYRFVHIHYVDAIPAYFVLSSGAYYIKYDSSHDDDNVDVVLVTDRGVTRTFGLGTATVEVGNPVFYEGFYYEKDGCATDDAWKVVGTYGDPKSMGVCDTAVKSEGYTQILPKRPLTAYETNLMGTFTTADPSADLETFTVTNDTQGAVWNEPYRAFTYTGVRRSGDVDTGVVIPWGYYADDFGALFLTQRAPLSGGSSYWDERCGIESSIAVSGCTLTLQDNAVSPFRNTNAHPITYTKKDCATCGNAKCEAGETCQSCPSDCGACGGGSCAHDRCATGASLAATCDPCITQICKADPYCCTTAWDASCVREVSSVCSAACP